jgi:hypothetical protein
MPIQQTATTSFKIELAQGVHNFGPTSPDTFKIALYTGLATLNADTTVYSTTNEVPNGDGYTTGGKTLTVSTTPTSSGSVAYWSFADIEWDPATFTARAALIYNSTEANKSVAVLDFGADKTAVTKFKIVFPTANSSEAILRIA